MMTTRNKVIEEHYRANFNIYVKKIRNRTQDWSLALPQEIVQEAYARALRYYRTFNKDVQTFDAWFNAILNNTLRKAQKEERQKGVNHEIDQDRTPEDEIVPSGYDVMGHIYEMPQGRVKSIITMYYLQGFKTKDIAEYLNVGHSNVRKIIMQWCRGIEQTYVNDVEPV